MNYAAHLDCKAIGLELQVFIENKLNSHSKGDLAAFDKTILAMRDVLECRLISGNFDYLMRVTIGGPLDYEGFYRNRLS